ncbi:hypothetical protein PIB30_082253, partial [Stylosanthes scabra]|nr:hypothetical protein [Stylosanthes scabra]
MRRTASICMGSIGDQPKLKTSIPGARIGMEVHAYTWKLQSSALKTHKSHAYAWNPTHMRGKQTVKGTE